MTRLLPVRGLPSDLGATGPAMMSRPSRVIVIEGRQISSTASEAVEARRMADAIPADALYARHLLTDRQHAVAARLAALWTAAGLNPRMTAPLDGSAAHGRSTAPDEAVQPVDRYRALMRRAPIIHIVVLEAMLCCEPPRHIGPLRAALDWLMANWSGADDE